MPRMMEITFLSSGFQFFSEGQCPLTPSSPTLDLLRHYTPTIPTTMFVENLNVIQSPDLRLLRKVYRGQQVI